MTAPTSSSLIPRRLILQAAGLLGGSAALGSCAKNSEPGSAKSTANRPLTVIGWSDADGTWKKMMDRYTKEIGKPVTYLEAPSDYPEMVAKYLNYMKAEYEGIDVYLLDDFSAGNFATAGWLEDMKPVLADSLDTFSANTKALFDIGGYSRVPIYIGAVAYYYRKDIMEQAGFSGPPTTWENQVSMGKTLKEKFPNMWPLEPMCSKDSGADALSVQLIWQGGGDASKPNDEGTKKALQYAYDLIYTHSITPKSITGIGTSEMNPLVQKGEAIAWYWYEGSEGRYNAKDSNVRGKWAFGPWPAGPGGPCAHLHSWGWSVPKFSPKREEALEFSKWATAPAQIKDFMIGGLKLPPPLESLLKDPAVRKQVSFCDYLSDYAQYLKWRPINNKSPLEFNNTIGRMLTSVVTKEKSVDDAATWGYNELQKLS